MHRITWETSTVKQPTLSICSPVDSSYVVWNVSFSEMAPFVFFHDTSGLGSPLTLTRKIAVSPERGVHSKWQACINLIHDKQAYIPSMLRLRRPPSSTVTGASLHLKSGVLLPSGMLVTYCVMITPGSLDLFFMMAETIREICWHLLSTKMDTNKSINIQVASGGVEWFVFATSRGQDCHTFPVTLIKQRTTDFYCDIYFSIGKFKVHLNEWMMNWDDSYYMHMHNNVYFMWPFVFSKDTEGLMIAKELHQHRTGQNVP